MNILKKFYLMWVSSIDPKFNKKLLSVPTPDIKFVYIPPNQDYKNLEMQEKYKLALEVLSKKP
jgi:hypothetical protein